MKRAAWLRGSLVGTFALTISCLLAWLVVSPYIDRDDASPASWRTARPATDMPMLPGYRSVWANNRPIAERIRSDDRVLEVVLPASQPFAAHDSDPLRQVAFMAARAPAALIVRLDHVLPARPPGVYDTDDVDDTNATVEAVVFDHSRTPWRPLDAIQVRSYRGTQVTQVGATRVVQRVDYVRVPRPGERYMLFLQHSLPGSRPSAVFGYGDAFEIRGSRVVNMSMPTSGAWRRSASLARVVSQVRQRAAATKSLPGGLELIESLIR